jgi:hypothetical protein
MGLNWKKFTLAGASVLALGGIAGFALGAPAADKPPTYKYDPTWPKELPNKWTMEGITGLFVDKDDHIWVLNRPRDFDERENAAAVSPPAGECCVAPPAVMEFDTAGNLLTAWGVPNSVPGWPKSEHTIFTDRAGNVYIGGAQPGDSLLKFSHDGKLTSDFGHRGPTVPAGTQQKQDNQQTDLLLRGVAAATLDEDAHEIYIADGYLNRRVLVYDWDTGKFKRGWGAYGKPLSEIDNNPQPPHDPKGPPAKDFKSPVHCVRISKDGLVYVCDRGGDRIQVFTKEGKYLKEFFIANDTLRGGSAGSVDFSSDPGQKYIFVADIVNNVVWELERDTGKVVAKIGHHGHQGGMFHFVHVAFMDSKGNLYTGEVDSGKRVQKFTPVP